MKNKLFKNLPFLLVVFITMWSNLIKAQCSTVERINAPMYIDNWDTNLHPNFFGQNPPPVANFSQNYTGNDPSFYQYIRKNICVGPQATGLVFNMSVATRNAGASSITSGNMTGFARLEFWFNGIKYMSILNPTGYDYDTPPSMVSVFNGATTNVSSIPTGRGGWDIPDPTSINIQLPTGVTINTGNNNNVEIRVYYDSTNPASGNSGGMSFADDDFHVYSLTLFQTLAQLPIPVISINAATCSAPGTATITNYNASNTYAFTPSGPTVGIGGLISGMIPGTNYTVNTSPVNDVCNIYCPSSGSTPFSIGAALPTPAPPVISGSDNLCEGGISVLTSSSPTGNHWYKDGVLISGATAQTYSVSTAGNYTVRVTSGGCESAASAVISVTDCPKADLSVTKTDGKTNYIPGFSTTYTIVAGNNGSIEVEDAIVEDLVPAGIPAINMSYTAVASAGSSTNVTGTQTGAINDLVSLPVGGTVTYTVTVFIPASFTGDLVNTVTITPPAGITDPDMTNNTATDTNTFECTGPDSDGDGIPDMCDLDADNDGILNCVENGFDGDPNTAFKSNGAATAFTNTPGDAPINQFRLINGEGQSGQAWSYGKIDFANDFIIEMKVLLSGADGIAVVFHNDPLGTSASGHNGQGLGARGIANGIALELDTFPNSCDNDNNNGGNCDPSFDHGSIRKTAGTQTSGWEKLAGDTQLGDGTVDDGLWHTVVVFWNANSRNISYSFDGVPVTDYTFPTTGSNAIETIFGGTTNVHFGFTASTGAIGSNNSIGFDNPCDIPLYFDTDGDGIPDYLDLDSDNDGCPDAIEGDENVTIDHLNPDGSINIDANGGVDAGGIPNLVNNGGTADVGGDQGQGIGQSQNAADFSACCPSDVSGWLDSDGDGISDRCDLDDDNDGILDTEECSNTIDDMFAVFSAGNLLDIVPSDFGLALNQKNQNVTADLSAKFGYPASSGAVMISITNASVHPTIDTWWTKDGEVPSVWNVSGTLSSFVLMSQNDEYYGNDSKTIHIYDNAAVIPITVPGLANQTAVPGVWGITETAGAKVLRKLDGVSSPSSNGEGNWRYANMNFGEKSFGFSTTTALGDPTYSVNIYLECDADGDGIPNRLDLDSDNDGCPDAIEGDGTFTEDDLTTASGTIATQTPNQNFGTAVDANGVPTVVGAGGQDIGTSQDATIHTCCNAGAVAPSVQNLENECPVETVNLNDAHTGTVPLYTDLVWFTNSSHSGAALSGMEITEAVAGTYYAFYYDSTNDCYSPVSDAVSVTIEDCCNAGDTAPPVQNLANECPLETVNLNDAHTGTLPSDTQLRWFNNSLHTGTALFGTQVTEAGTGTYYAFYYDSTNDCYSPVSNAVSVTIEDCCNAGTTQVPLSGAILNNQ